MENNKRKNQLQDSFYSMANAELSTGWVKRLVQTAKYDEAARVVNLLRNRDKPLVTNSRLHQIELDVWDAMLRTRTASDENFNFAQKMLHDAISKLEIMPPDIKRNIVLGRAYNNLGYLLRVRGKFYGACITYRKALPIWRELKLDEEQATTLNNLAFALAEVGEFDVARNMAQDARDLRRKLNNFSLMSLNLNTMAHIAVRENQPEAAIKYVNEALKRSHQIPNRRAYGLTLIVGSEAHRRRVKIKLRDTGSVGTLKDINKALDYSREACTIFAKEIKEPEREVEALIELGCTYRDLAKYSRKSLLPTEKAKEYGKQAEKVLRRAAKIAKREKIAYRAVDALVNLAWLKYYLRQNIEDVLEEAFDEIPNEYKTIHRGKGGEARMENLIVPYLTQLGKAYTLRGQLYFGLFNDKTKSQDERDQKLEDAIWSHAMALEYNSWVNAAVIMQMRNTRDRIYENIKKLNPREISLILSSLDTFENEFHIKQCEMRNFLMWHGLIDG